ncbi:MAG: response regulator [Prolixibacteraceae bacterium]|nr:response regulator [Prolixibacteraceae bacterium]
MGEKKYNILVAEDNSINVQVARFMLKNVSEVLDIVWNGEEAIEKYLKNDYDFILMDVKMPVLNGYEATLKIRDIEAAKKDDKRIPIIALTATNTFEEEQKCLKSGMDGFLTKPYQLDDLKRVLTSIGI